MRIRSRRTDTGQAGGGAARRRAALAAALPFGLLLLLGPSGCSLLRVSDEVQQNQLQLAELSRRQRRLAGQIDSLRVLQRQQLELLRRLRADQGAEFGALGRRIDALEQLLRASSRQLDRVAYGVPLGGAAPGPAPAAGAAVPDTVEVPVVEGERLFDAAYTSLSQGRYPLAIMEFRDYLQRFPDGRLADNCQYWIGESYYAQAEYATAAQAFLELVQRYPDSDLVAAAYLKAAFCHAALGQTEAAATYLRRVIDDFPYSDEAIRARDRLQRLQSTP